MLMRNDMKSLIIASVLIFSFSVLADTNSAELERNQFVAVTNALVRLNVMTEYQHIRAVVRNAQLGSTTLFGVQLEDTGKCEEIPARVEYGTLPHEDQPSYHVYFPKSAPERCQ
jgi:hypothetical protein